MRFVFFLLAFKRQSGDLLVHAESGCEHAQFIAAQSRRPITVPCPRSAAVCRDYSAILQRWNPSQ